MRYSIVPTLVLPALSQAFNLDSSNKYWNYTTNSLASTTSDACKEAYSAEIDCDEYLVQLVNAGETRFFLDSMEPEDFSRTCITSCHASLAKYIANVRKSCAEPGDAAVEALGFLGNKGRRNVPVDTIGGLFEFTLMRSCAKDEDGDRCYLSESGALPSDFDCQWRCALAYYWNQKKYPYGLWNVGDPDVLDFDEDNNRIKVNNDMLFKSNEGKVNQQGWENIQKCGFTNSTAPFDIGLKNDGGEIASHETEHESCNSKSGNCSSSSTVAATETATTTSVPTSTTAASGGHSVFATMGSLSLVALSIYVLL